MTDQVIPLHSRTRETTRFTNAAQLFELQGAINAALMTLIEDTPEALARYQQANKALSDVLVPHLREIQTNPQKVIGLELQNMLRMVAHADIARKDAAGSRARFFDELDTIIGGIALHPEERALVSRLLTRTGLSHIAVFSDGKDSTLCPRSVRELLATVIERIRDVDTTDRTWQQTPMSALFLAVHEVILRPIYIAARHRGYEHDALCC
jgi:hypothetical protein